MRRAARRGAIASVLALGLASAAAAAPAPPGALACAGCHAARPLSPDAPPALEGRPAADLARALLAFRSGAQDGTVMPRIARGFDDAEIAALASWLAARTAP